MRAPELSAIQVPHPGTPSVFSWPVVDDVEIKARIRGEGIIIEWSPELDWPWFVFDIGQGPTGYFGNSGLVYRTQDGIWVADATEWMRTGREDGGTSYPWAEKFRHGPHDGGPIGLFVAGLWRHSPDLPEYRRRTDVRWFSWPDLQPYNWDEEPPPPPPSGGWEDAIAAMERALEGLKHGAGGGGA